MHALIMLSKKHFNSPSTVTITLPRISLYTSYTVYEAVISRFSDIRVGSRRGGFRGLNQRSRHLWSGYSRVITIRSVLWGSLATAGG